VGSKAVSGSRCLGDVADTVLAAHIDPKKRPGIARDWVSLPFDVCCLGDPWADPEMRARWQVLAGFRADDHRRPGALKRPRNVNHFCATWLDSHLALGVAFQRGLERGDLPVLKRPIRANDIVVWRPEPKFPRLVIDMAPTKASVIEPGDDGGAKPLKVRPDFLAAIDITAIREAAGT
jgi:hypothetical protein